MDTHDFFMEARRRIRERKAEVKAERAETSGVRKVWLAWQALGLQEALTILQKTMSDNREWTGEGKQ